MWVNSKLLKTTRTKNNINRTLAIIVDGKIYSSPIVNSEITKGKAVISGNLTKEEALSLHQEDLLS